MNNRQCELQKMREMLLSKFGKRPLQNGRCRDAMHRLVRRILLDERRHHRFLHGAKKKVLRHLGVPPGYQKTEAGFSFAVPLQGGFIGIKVTNNAPPVEIPLQGLEVTPL